MTLFMLNSQRKNTRVISFDSHITMNDEFPELHIYELVQTR